MYENCSIAGRGLKMVFLGQIVAILGVLLGWIPLVGLIVVLGSYALKLMGLDTASAAHPSYKPAFITAACCIIVNVIVGILHPGFIASGLTALNAGLDLLTVYFVCSASSALLSSKGDATQAARGDLIWKLYAACTVVGVVCGILSGIPIFGILAQLTGVIVSLVAGILYLLFLYKAQQSLQS